MPKLTLTCTSPARRRQPARCTAGCATPPAPCTQSCPSCQSAASALPLLPPLLLPLLRGAWLRRRGCRAQSCAACWQELPAGLLGCCLNAGFPQCWTGPTAAAAAPTAPCCMQGRAAIQCMPLRPRPRMHCPKQARWQVPLHPNPMLTGVASSVHRSWAAVAPSQSLQQVRSPPPHQ